eukprot:3106334-Amphidinium_carterae.1
MKGKGTCWFGRHSSTLSVATTFVLVCLLEANWAGPSAAAIPIIPCRNGSPPSHDRIISNCKGSDSHWEYNLNQRDIFLPRASVAVMHEAQS